jgi:hypothetical protein
MSISHMRVEDRIAGDNNWSPWKARIIFVLEDLKLWDIFEVPILFLPVTGPALLVEFKKRNNKAKRTICDVVQDHIFPHFTGNTYAFEMWASLSKLYESYNENRNLVLHDRLMGICMLEDESVTSFLGRYTQIRASLVSSKRWWIPNLW